MKMRIAPWGLFCIGILAFVVTNKQSIGARQEILVDPIKLSELIDHQDYKKYFSNIKENEHFISEFGESDNIKYYMACLDEDDIPEMLIADECIHSSQITIYRYDVDNEDIYFLGRIGSDAGLTYYPYKNNIICSYGNQGFFFTICYSILDGKLQADEGYADDNNLGPEKFYRGIQASENLEDESLDYYSLYASDIIEISEEEYLDYFSLEGEMSYVSYDEDFFYLD